MTLSWKHVFVSPKAEGVDATIVGPNEWNDAHAATTDTATGMIVGRDNSGAGPLQELPAIYDVAKKVWNFLATTVTGGLLVPSGTTVQRPVGPTVGTIRYNTTTSALEIFIGSTWQTILTGNAVPVGATLGWYSDTAPAGYLFVNGQTIGNTGSGADFTGLIYETLFTFLWDNLAQTVAPVSGGRGVSASADWAALKNIALPDECGRVSAGMDTMGGIGTKNRLNKTTNPLGPDGLVLGSSGGESLHTLTIDEMPSHTHSYSAPATGASNIGLTGNTLTTLAFVGAAGGDDPHNNVQQTIIKNVIIKY